MPSSPRPLGELVAMGVIAGLVAFGLALATRPRGAARVAPRASTALGTRLATTELHPGAARITVRSRDGALARDVDLALVVDGVARPLSFGRDDLRRAGDALRANLPLPLGDATVDATLDLRADGAHDALVLTVSVPP